MKMNNCDDLKIFDYRGSSSVLTMKQSNDIPAGTFVLFVNDKKITVYFRYKMTDEEALILHCDASSKRRMPKFLNMAIGSFLSLCGANNEAIFAALMALDIPCDDIAELIAVFELARTGRLNDKKALQ